jgi:hypothetical protein
VVHVVPEPDHRARKIQIVSEGAEAAWAKNKRVAVTGKGQPNPPDSQHEDEMPA